MKESGIQTAVEAYLQYLENLSKLVYIKNNSGALQNQQGRYLRFGKRGSSDFLIFVKRGRTIHLEIKNEKGKQSLNQLEYEMKVKQLGHIYKIARSVDDVENILRNYI